MISRLRWDERRHRWRRVFPGWWWTAWALAAAMSVAAVDAQRRAVKTWTPLQRAYAWSYAWSVAALTLERDSGTYSLLLVRGRTGGEIAMDADVSAEEATEGEVLRPSDAAIKAGARRLEWSARRYPHALVNEFLRTGIYGNRSLGELLEPGFAAARTTLTAGLLLLIAWRLWWLLAAGALRGSQRVPSPAPAPTSPSPARPDVPVRASSARPRLVHDPVRPTLSDFTASPKPTSPPQPPKPFFE